VKMRLALEWVVGMPVLAALNVPVYEIREGIGFGPDLVLMG
jgi:hypothetical protein